MRALLAIALALGVARVARGQITTAQYDNARTGATLTERQLTPAVVTVARFGKLFSLAVDGDIYAQPLFLPRLAVPGKGVHDVVFVATEHNDVYAFDAHGAPPEPLWHVALGPPVAARDVWCPFIRPDVGVTAAPVIDTTTGTLFVLARTRESGSASAAAFAQRLHALDVRTGAEQRGGPVTIAATARGRGAGAVEGSVRFDPVHENPRSALLLVRGTVYLAWASSCDVGPYHGWVMAYAARTLAQVAALNTTPDGEQGGIWQGQAGLAADAAGVVYAVTGNGSFDADGPGGRDYGNSVLKLVLAGRELAVRDFFTPFNQQQLNAQDLDLGSGGPVLLPAEPGAHPHLLVIGGKGGGLYVLDRDALGRFHAGDNRHAVQTLATAGGVFGAVAYWNRHLYLLGSDDVVRDFVVEPGAAPLRLVAQGTVRFIDPGATPTISANGAQDGIVWIVGSKGWRAPDQPAVLHAFDAANVARELYNSEQNSRRDRAGLTLRFTIPTVVDGRVYVATKGAVDVYGLLAARESQP